LRLGSPIAGAQLTLATTPALLAYAVVLLVTVGICLAFDAWDVVRWLRGERFVLGSRAAYEAGASRYTLGDQHRSRCKFRVGTGRAAGGIGLQRLRARHAHGLGASEARIHSPTVRWCIPV
jgi:hypothetical protein